MAIVRVDGIEYLDSGVVFLGDDGVVEVVVEHKERRHEIALKLRSDDGSPEIRHGNPRDDRTVVHLANIPEETATGSGKTSIGEISGDDLFLAFDLEPMLVFRSKQRIPNRRI